MITELEGDYALDESGIRTGIMDPELLPVFWTRIEEMLDRIPHTWEGFTKDSLYHGISQGHIQVWLSGSESQIKFVVFTKLVDMPAHRLLEVFWAAGVGMLDKSGPTLDAILDNFAFRNACEEIVVVGRGGWEKILGNWGFRRKGVVLGRKVANRRAH